jgi:hypothetical protein
MVTSSSAFFTNKVLAIVSPPARWRALLLFDVFSCVGVREVVLARRFIEACTILYGEMKQRRQSDLAGVS